MSSKIHKLTVFEDTGFSLMARIQGTDAKDVQQADVSSIAYSVYDLSSTGSPTDTGSLTVATVIYDTLQTDSRWDIDTTGYNFKWDVPASHVADGAKNYRFEIAFTPAIGEVYHAIYEVATTNLFRS